MSASISLPSVAVTWSAWWMRRMMAGSSSPVSRASYHVAGGLHDGEEHALRHAPHRRRAAAAQ